MKTDIVIVVCFVTWCLGTFPVLHFLWMGYRERRQEILGAFSSRTTVFYFKRYRADRTAPAPEESARQLRRMYDRRFGRRMYGLPLLVYGAALSLTVVVITASAAGTLGSSSLFDFRVPDQVAWALAGAYLWVVSDLLERYRRRDMVAWSLYDAAFRLVISAPLAYSIVWIVGAIGENQIVGFTSNTLAFGLGVFPTNTLLMVLRRRVAQRIGLGQDSNQRAKYELEGIQGINTTLAERFADVGIMTFHQLAYEDPIQLAMRMNLPFRVTLDLMSQALLALYVENMVPPRATQCGTPLGTNVGAPKPEPAKEAGEGTVPPTPGGVSDTSTSRKESDRAGGNEKSGCVKLGGSTLLIYQRYLLRSALDALGLYEALRNATEESSRAILNALACDLGFAPTALIYILREIGEDPATIFLNEMLKPDE
jgi:hypothetical protein